MSNLAKTLREIRERSAVAPIRYKIINRDQLDSLRESPEDVRTLLSVIDSVLLAVRDNPTAHAEIIYAMEDAVRPDIVLTEHQGEDTLEP